MWKDKLERMAIIIERKMIFDGDFRRFDLCMYVRMAASLQFVV